MAGTTLSLQDDTVPTVFPDIWSGIEVESSYDAPMTVVSIGIKGPYSYASYQQHMEQLRVADLAPRVYSCCSPRRFSTIHPYPGCSKLVTQHSFSLADG